VIAFDAGGGRRQQMQIESNQDEGRIGKVEVDQDPKK
jgi:hypothetical protein